MNQLGGAVTGAFAVCEDMGIVQKLKQFKTTLIGLIASVEYMTEFAVDAFSQRAATPDFAQ